VILRIYYKGDEMRFVKPAVFLIAKSAPQREAIHKWLLHIGCPLEVASKYADQSKKTNGEAVTELAGRRCYLSFVEGLNPNVTKIREDITDYINNIMKAGHG
jgi:thymidylate synthase (FAD)